MCVLIFFFNILKIFGLISNLLLSDPNFKFAGAGSTVFGSKTTSSLNSSEKAQNRSFNDSVQKEDNEEDDGEVDNEQEHDPHFEPIVPLPDAIEVRTGEEDEEKGNFHMSHLNLSILFKHFKNYIYIYFFLF